VTNTLHAPHISAPGPGWKLGEAKAQFSKVVRLAAAGQPQRVTVRGRNAVVVVAADEFDRLRARKAAASLHDLLSQSPLNRLEFGGESVRGPVREVDF
jgi:antitoxin Phd